MWVISASFWIYFPLWQISGNQRWYVYTMVQADNKEQEREKKRKSERRLTDTNRDHSRNRTRPARIEICHSTACATSKQFGILTGRDNILKSWPLLNRAEIWYLRIGHILYASWFLAEKKSFSNPWPAKFDAKIISSVFNWSFCRRGRLVRTISIRT